MRWIAPILGMLLMTGCGEFGYSIRRECRKVVQAFKDANSGDHSASGLPSQSDASKAQDEQDIINDLNGTVGNRNRPTH